MSTMDMSTFADCADRFGPDLNQWPEPRRGAARALEEGAAGRPRRHEDRAYGETRGLRLRIAHLERELRRSEAELDIARSEAGRAVERRLAAKAVR